MPGTRHTSLNDRHSFSNHHSSSVFAVLQYSAQKTLQCSLGRPGQLRRHRLTSSIILGSIGCFSRFSNKISDKNVRWEGWREGRIEEGTERRMEGGMEGGLIWPHGLRIIYIMAGRRGGENEISSCWPLVMLHPVPK